jgi:hypothetical protein
LKPILQAARQWQKEVPSRSEELGYHSTSASFRGRQAVLKRREDFHVFASFKRGIENSARSI